MWLLIPILLYSLTFLYVRHVYSHWARKGFPSERTVISWQFFNQVYQREFRHVNAICEAYRVGREQLWGIYCFFRPILLVRDIKIAHTILEQSNGHFNGIKWDCVKGYRRFNILEKIAPIFSRSHLEGMQRNITKVGDNLIEHLEDLIGNNGNAVQVDMQHLMRVYAINIMGNLVYGQNVNNFEQQEDVLTKYVERDALHSGIQSFTLSRLPKKSSLTYRLRDLIKNSIEQRELNSVVRKDMLQLIIKFRNGNELFNNNATKFNWHIENIYEDDKLLSVKQIAKVAEELLKMSLDTIAATATLTIYEILSEPLILEKIRTEIKNLASDQPVQLTIEHLDSMKYMDMCIMETLRKYPPIPIIERVCRKTYTLPNSRYTIVEGKTIMVPVLAIQRDEKYFADPMKYKPTRFLGKQSEQQKQAFMGFGLGGAQCIAQNFSKIVIKLALLKLLHNFELELKLNTKTLDIVHQPAPYISAKDGLNVKIKNQPIKAKFYL